MSAGCDGDRMPDTASPALVENVSIVRQLRREWLPKKDSEAAGPEHEPIRIRLHRSISWIDQAERVRGAGDQDSVDISLISYWIALNALYGTWDAERRQTTPDRESLAAFTTLIGRHDRQCQRLQPLFIREKQTVEAIVQDLMLVQRFWQDPDPEVPDEGGPTPAVVFALRSAVREQRMSAALDIVLQRIYFVRCQLVHGGATCGGSLNRDAVDRCAEFMRALLPEIIRIIIEQAWSDPEARWADLCYPPLR